MCRGRDTASTKPQRELGRRPLPPAYASSRTMPSATASASLQRADVGGHPDVHLLDEKNASSVAYHVAGGDHVDPPPTQAPWIAATPASWPLHHRNDSWSFSAVDRNPVSAAVVPVLPAAGSRRRTDGVSALSAASRPSRRAPSVSALSAPPLPGPTWSVAWRPSSRGHRWSGRPACTRRRRNRRSRGHRSAGAGRGSRARRDRARPGRERRRSGYGR